MTAFIVKTETLAAAQAAAGDQFTVPLSADGQEPATHIGCNWVGCPAEIETTLAQIEGVSMGIDFWALCADLGLSLISSGEV